MAHVKAFAFYPKSTDYSGKGLNKKKGMFQKIVQMREDAVQEKGGVILCLDGCQEMSFSKRRGRKRRKAGEDD